MHTEGGLGVDLESFSFSQGPVGPLGNEPIEHRVANAHDWKFDKARDIEDSDDLVHYYTASVHSMRDKQPIHNQHAPSDAVRVSAGYTYSDTNSTRKRQEYWPL